MRSTIITKGITKRPKGTGESSERVISVAVQFPEDSDFEVENSLGEVERLVETLGGTIVHSMVQRRKRKDPAFYIGRGKTAELADAIREHEVDLVAFDRELSGSQQKNLEKELKVRVVDRTAIILDIFSRHARTKEAKNQVELACLQYLSTHLTRRWTHLERQKGGIGLRGVGEKQIELDRRMIRARISKLKDEMAHSLQERATQHAHRDRFLRVALVGYTNAGKSTLMNNLTSSEVYVDDKLFATLDSTVRVIDPKTRPSILLSDTVGFIDRLPHALVASFRSTLQEVHEADVLLHVVDLSSPSYREQMKVTQEVLQEIGAGEKPMFLVFNKVDLCEQVLLPRIVERSYIDSVAVSAFRPADMERLRNELYAYFERDMIEMEVVVPYRNTWLQAQIHEHSKVVEKSYLDEGALFRIRIPRPTAQWLNLAPLASAREAELDKVKR